MTEDEKGKNRPLPDPNEERSRVIKEDSEPNNNSDRGRTTDWFRQGDDKKK